VSPNARRGNRRWLYRLRCDHETVSRGVGRGSVGHPFLDEIDYGDELRDSPSQMEALFAIFANVLELDDQGEPVNEPHAERRAAVWIYRYCTGNMPPGEPEFEGWEVELH
jgi:hypothetical protein